MPRRGATKKSRGRGRLTHGFMPVGFHVKCDAAHCGESRDTLLISHTYSILQGVATSIWEWMEGIDYILPPQAVCLVDPHSLPCVDLRDGGWKYLLEDGSGWSDLTESLYTCTEPGATSINCDSFASFVQQLFWRMKTEETYVQAVRGLRSSGGSKPILRAQGPREASIRIDCMFTYGRTG